MRVTHPIVLAVCFAMPLRARAQEGIAERVGAEESIFPPAAIDPRLVPAASAPPIRAGVRDTIVSYESRLRWAGGGFIAGAVAGAVAGAASVHGGSEAAIGVPLATGIMGALIGAPIGAAIPARSRTRCGGAVRLLRAAAGTAVGTVAGALGAIVFPPAGVVVWASATVAGPALALRGCH